MNIYKQICSLEQSKSLMELGIVQGKSLMCYANQTYPKKIDRVIPILHDELNTEHTSYEMLYSTFNTSELLGMLQPQTEYGVLTICTCNGATQWEAKYYDFYKKTSHFNQLGSTPADALAEMMLKMIHGFSVDVSELNKRLIKL